jgi:hypothetical protein
VNEILKIQYYPEVNIPQIKDPNKLYAIPLAGILVKIILLIPVFLLLFGLCVALWVMTIINSFYVLFQGKYWVTAYELDLMYMRYSTKATFYLSGLTDKYPGFSYKDKDDSMVRMAMPANPSKLFAIPLLGLLVRIILLIPFYIWNSIVANAYKLGLVVYAWWSVLFRGEYPEAIYEIVKDSQRLSLAQFSYLVGLSDNYPSFNISWNHKNIKIALVIGAIILFIFQFMNNRDRQNEYRYQDYGSYSYSSYE